jgi:ATP-dependent RNA helicase DeaD
MSNFTQFELPSTLIEALERMLITTPTPVQEKTIPVALKGFDLLASAHTGTGKTVAYLIPLILKLLESKQQMALILAPTRELAIQVNNTLQQMLSKPALFNTALLIGGAPMFKQYSELKRKPRVIVGTPGRINDHLTRGSLDLEKVGFLIIDEADRMLDMGFGIQLDQIAEFLPETRQTLMFSATVAPNIEKLSKKYLKNPERISIHASFQPAPKIKQEVVHISQAEKKNLLTKELEQREGSIIVFVKTKRKADTMSKELRGLGHACEAMHGDLTQNRREKVLRSFRSGKNRIMIATDVAARGLDIPHILHVINYDLPECPEDYVHRIGRTGRADAEGNALSFVSPDEQSKWKEIFKLLNPEAKDQENQKHSKPQKPYAKRPPNRFKPNKYNNKRKKPPFSKSMGAKGS